MMKTSLRCILSKALRKWVTRDEIDTCKKNFKEFLHEFKSYMPMDLVGEFNKDGVSCSVVFKFLSSLYDVQDAYSERSLKDAYVALYKVEGTWGNPRTFKGAGTGEVGERASTPRTTRRGEKVSGELQDRVAELVDDKTWLKDEFCLFHRMVGGYAGPTIAHYASNSGRSRAAPPGTFRPTGSSAFHK
ncbi:hypothetical protein GIB67_034137 [Kingdonia uniflora]|uniref:Uncharacterized protein n=1 Tax=Kingdonia uniflora TaxID=39325 RepID=A0A7J7N5J6_9MAGN|nr:hypothetical protein GIB67_034137 [Kingdonia uniflora]